MTESDQICWDDYFQSLGQLFRQGQFSPLWSKLKTLRECDIPEARLHKYYFYVLTCAVYGIGDLNKAKHINRNLDFKFHPTIRYRLCLRLRDYTTARRLRRDHHYNENELADFRHTLGLHCLAKGKYKPGFHFYQERYRAINTTKSLLEPLKYHYITDNPIEDPGVIVLEQGVGEVFISLLHIKESGCHEKSKFCGMPKYRRLIERYFPQATYHSKLTASEFQDKPAILAVDFLKRSWLNKKSLSTDYILDAPLRTRHSIPRYGICWRGGSAQNRREERYIPLQFFVEFLPKQYNYLVLQYDVSDEEKKFLRAHPHIQIPFLDLTVDALATFNLVRELAGVISVAGANWHLAGCANIPFLAIMHNTPHWFWGKDADAKSVYSSATTIAKESLSYNEIDAWIKATLYSWQSRDAGIQISNSGLSDRPIFVTGLPGAGLSRAMKYFSEQNVWVGPDSLNNTPISDDSYENPAIQNRLIFNILKNLNASEDCITFPPCPEQLPPFPWLRFQIERVLRDQGYDKNVSWVLKDFRLAVLWPLFARAYPDATWVIVDQDIEQVGLDMINSKRFGRYSTSLEYWKMFLNVLNDRICSLRHGDESVVTMSVEESPASIRSLVDAIAGRTGASGHGDCATPDDESVRREG